MLATEGVGAEGITSWKMTEGETATSGTLMASCWPTAGDSGTAAVGSD